ncbi:MAG TPA: ATP-binding cassette domain-containing protein [Myxococcota bacterium]|nr:ATP-binding cassette domain-containing protein [Myxococcota bacterium]
MTSVCYSGEVDAAPLLQVRKLAKNHRLPGFERRTVQALKPISFEVGRGELVVVEGASGAGKTTLLHCLARLLTPDDGALLWKGHDVTRVRGPALRDYRRRVRLLFQHPSAALDPRFTIVASVAEPLVLTGSDKAEADMLAREALERTGAHELAGRYPATLSGGERQRVALARALVGTPELVLADEPVSALDEAARAEALQTLTTLQRELGFACLLVSHAPVVGARRLRL